MVNYRLTTKKTRKGYRVSISIDNGECLTDLNRGIHRFFKTWNEEIETKESKDKYVAEARNEWKKLRSAKVIKPKNKKLNKGDG